LANSNTYVGVEIVGATINNTTVVNTAVEFIVNDERPTQRARHVDVQFFAVQQWRRNGHIVAKRLPGPINGADSMTKPTPYDLFTAHMRYAMGEYRLDTDPSIKDSTVLSDVQTAEVGEGVGNRASHG
jgi:hypothetical protein